MNKLIINPENKKSQINRNIYGHFSEHLGRCIYSGIYVGENSEIPNENGMRKDVVGALRNIKVPVLRWPGGCFADEYHWKDGIGEKSKRKKMINTNWGGLVEDNSFGTHEFMELCRQLECEPYVNGNLGSGTVQEMSEWVEYLTFDGVSPMAQLRSENGQKEPWALKYFGVGNENWGCGGNMRPEYYADLYRRYNTYVRNYGENKIYRIACGANSADYNWTKVVMERAGNFMDAITLHYYTVPSDWQHKGSATDFTLGEYYLTLQKAMEINQLVKKHSDIMDQYDPDKKVGLIVDEWGTWYDVEPGTNPGFLYQQNTMRDALVAALTLNCFNRNSHRVVMANLAQIVNVLQAVILTEGDKMVLTPTYHVFDLYKGHHDATLLDTKLQTYNVGKDGYSVSQLDVSASQNENGHIHITLANLSADAPCAIECELKGSKDKTATARILTGAIDAKNDFEAPNNVQIKAFEGIAQNGDTISFEIPPCSVMEIVVK